MRVIYVTFLLIIYSIVFSQSQLNEVHDDIRKLNSMSAAQIYWNSIFADDQNNNGGGANANNESTDLINLYKVVLMIEKFGYPTSDKFDYPAPAVPWAVWSHCNSPRVKEYTIAIIRKGNKMDQLPPGMYPNYFVGGLLLDAYGLDMEFDQSFKNIEQPLMDKAIKQFEETDTVIRLRKLKRLIKEDLKSSRLKEKEKLGVWKFEQHNEVVNFAIKLMQDNHWYLTSYKNNKSEFTRRIAVDKQLKTFRPLGGLNLYYFFIDESNRLHLKDNDGNIIKSSI